MNNGIRFCGLLLCALALQPMLYAEEPPLAPMPSINLESLTREKCLLLMDKQVQISGKLVECALGWALECKDFVLFLSPPKAYAPDRFGSKAQAVGSIKVVDLRSARPHDEALHDGHRQVMVLTLEKPIRILKDSEEQYPAESEAEGDAPKNPAQPSEGPESRSPGAPEPAGE